MLCPDPMVLADLAALQSRVPQGLEVARKRNDILLAGWNSPASTKRLVDNETNNVWHYSDGVSLHVCTIGELHSIRTNALRGRGRRLER